jgi:hypothetical protein
MTREITVVIDENPDLLGSMIESAPKRFAELITRAIAAEAPKKGRQRAPAVARTLISASIGIKHQVHDRITSLQRLDVAIGVLLPSAA